MGKAIVLGASGFLGSHVTRALVAAGRNVRIMTRPNSDTSATDDLDIERVQGDALERQSIARAIAGCDSVFYCIVDARAWLRDPAPLYRVNVDGLVNAMDAALTAGVKRFVLTSTYATLGIHAGRASTEADAFNWPEKAPHYVMCRVAAEQRFFEYCREYGLPGVACCVANTYGAGDIAPTPHGDLIRRVAIGQIPVYWEGGGPCVGIEDAASGMLAAERLGRIGERYILSDRWFDYRELFAVAAQAAGRKAPVIKVPMSLLHSAVFINDLRTSLTGTDSRFSVVSLQCARLLPDADATKARTQLLWRPRPTEQAIAQAVNFYLGRTS